MPDEIRSPESKIPFTREPIEAERLPWDDFNKMLKRVVDDGQIAMVTERGKMVAVVIPMTMGKLVQQALDNNPEWAAQITESLDHPETWVPASEIFNQDPTTT
jgi:antitoxin (DNA-binding transcriptional repressor) of toxin-antitoxin stability system